MENRIYFTSSIPYIISQYIREYDISKANINILLYKGVIDIDKYNFLYNADRMTRQVYIGKMIRNNSNIGNILKYGIKEMIDKFIMCNNIEDQDILSLKNDAIFIINKIPTITKFENIEFKNKNTYTSYLNINGIEVYYNLDQINSTEQIDIKGINDDKLLIHQNYFINFLCEYLYNIENMRSEENLRWFKDFYNKYVNLQLDTGYYITFDSISSIKTIDIGMYNYNIIGYNTQKNIIDISYNLNILRLLYRYLLEIHFNNKK